MLIRWHLWKRRLLAAFDNHRRWRWPGGSSGLLLKRLTCVCCTSSCFILTGCTFTVKASTKNGTDGFSRGNGCLRSFLRSLLLQTSFGRGLVKPCSPSSPQNIASHFTRQQEFWSCNLARPAETSLFGSLAFDRSFPQSSLKLCLPFPNFFLGLSYPASGVQEIHLTLRGRSRVNGKHTRRQVCAFLGIRNKFY